MVITAWNNGEHNPTGAGYGFKIGIEDRNKYFRKEWKNVFLGLKGEKEMAVANVDKSSFWNDACRELISKDIGIWLIKNRKALWPKGYPPKMRMENIGNKRFKVEFI